MNYDADFDSIDLFRHMVDALAKTAKGSAKPAELDAFGGSRKMQEQEARLAF